MKEKSQRLPGSCPKGSSEGKTLVKLFLNRGPNKESARCLFVFVATRCVEP